AVDPAHGEPQPIGGGEGQCGRGLPDVEGDQRESGTPHEEIGGPYGDVAPAAAADPQKTAAVDTGCLGTLGYEGAVSVDQSHHPTLLQRTPQTGKKKTRSSRREPAHDLGDPTALDDVARVAHARSFHQPLKAYHMLSSQQAPTCRGWRLYCHQD